MRNSKLKTKRNLAIPGEPISQEEFVALIKEAEKGPFYELGSFEDFKKRILGKWKKKYGK
jgi:Txe/YoeB family toxin of Txe-Axe toxin-antitoxin module